MCKNCKICPSERGISLEGIDALSVLNSASAIARMDDDREIFIEVLAAFLEQLPQDMRDIEMKVDNNDIKGARKMAHKIRGASLNIGAEKMSFIADKIENMSSDSPSDWRYCISELKKECEAFKTRASSEGKSNKEK